MQRSRGISQQLGGLQNFCANVDKGEEEIYQFSCALETLLGRVGGDAEYVADIIRKALEELQDGGAE